MTAEKPMELLDGKTAIITGVDYTAGFAAAVNP